MNLNYQTKLYVKIKENHNGMQIEKSIYDNFEDLGESLKHFDLVGHRSLTIDVERVLYNENS